MRLREALEVKRGDVVAFTGAGGKTSALLQLGLELAEERWRVLATTTTRIAENELAYFPHCIQWDANSPLAHYALTHVLDQHQFVFVYSAIENKKVIGISTAQVRQVIDTVNSDVCLIEADGSRRLPLKAPKAHEPVLPPDTSLAVPVAGLDALGKPLNAQNVYNVDAIVERYGFGYDMPILPAWLAQIVRDETLGLKDIPPQARIVALLNQTASGKLSMNSARKAAAMILTEKRIEAVVIGAVKQRATPVHEVQHRIGAVVLAGGLSRRMGRSKMLLPWGEHTVIEAIIKRLLPFQLTDVVVVTGHKSAEVEEILSDYPVRTVFNPHFAAGEMLSSLKTGLQALTSEIDAALVLLGDQPQVKTRIIHRLLKAYAESNASVVAPFYREQRGHPILIGRRHWSEILDLKTGQAPREIITRYPVYVVESEDDSILRDIDTPEQYARELRLAGYGK
jgi:molybdenum cofactor cytidylyltransferase